MTASVSLTFSPFHQYKELQAVHPAWSKPTMDKGICPTKIGPLGGSATQLHVMHDAIFLPACLPDNPISLYSCSACTSELAYIVWHGNGL